MNNNLVIYVDIQPNNTNTVLGIHGYVYENIVEKKSSKRPNNTNITNVGYVNSVDSKEK